VTQLPLTCGSLLFAGLLGVAIAQDSTPPVTPTVPSVQPFLLQSVEDKYSAESAKGDTAVAKAETEAAKLRKIAGDARLKAYRDKLAEATKAGDFDKAVAIKARITELESEPEAGPQKRPRPKDVVKFNGHSYALIKEPATWHVAKQRCEDMGGHLVCVETAAEENFVKSFCGQENVWVGGSDEDVEGEWRWCAGNSPVRVKINSDNGSSEHHLSLFKGEWHDGPSGHRHHYVCEWDR
jgi:hypothetical protein